MVLYHLCDKYAHAQPPPLKPRISCATAGGACLELTHTKRLHTNVTVRPRPVGARSRDPGWEWEVGCSAAEHSKITVRGLAGSTRQPLSRSGHTQARSTQVPLAGRQRPQSSPDLPLRPPPIPAPTRVTSSFAHRLSLWATHPAIPPVQLS